MKHILYTGKKQNLFTPSKIKIKLRRIIAISMFFTSGISSLYAQNSATEGTEFYLNFTQNNDNLASNPAVVAQIRYVVSKTCYITTQYGDSTYLDSNVLYSPGTYTRSVDKSKTYTNISVGGTATNNKYLKITSTEKIGVYGINMAYASTDATTILPVEVLGTHYTILSNSANFGSSTISVIAPTSGTIINIKNPAGTTVVSNFPIPNGRVFLYTETANFDLSGYTVEANNNICVFSSVQCGLQASCGYCDHNWEQMLPTNTAGKNYIVWCMSPGNGTNSECEDKIKIIALENSTVITKKIGANSSNFTLNKNQSTYDDTPTGTNNNTYKNNSTGVVQYTSSKPFIVEHILGHAPSIKWISPIEQRITSAILSVFVPTASSIIANHTLHILIPEHSQNNMSMKEIRNGVETNVNLNFYTNTTNPNYKIAYKNYSANDNVMIYLNNPGGFIAYITGQGATESYIITAGAGAYNLQCYFSIMDKAASNETYYTSTTINSHTFENTDTITVKRTIEESFTSVKWLINGVQYPIVENSGVVNTLKFPASALVDGVNTISMSVRFLGAGADSLYTGLVWFDDKCVNTVIPNDIVCSNVVCVGKSIQVYNSTLGGVWTSNNSNVSIANPNANPTTITGVTAGKTYITYTVSDGKCQTKKTKLVKVASSTAPTIVIGVER